MSLPAEREDARHVFHVFAARVPQRDAWRARLAELGIQVGVHYPIPIHLQPAHRDLGYLEGSFPVSEAIAREVLSLPIYPELTDDQIDSVAEAFRAGIPAWAPAGG
jgi:dTDP-4-amino-4,6-dideoxygalactose transaminase